MICGDCGQEFNTTACDHYYRVNMDGNGLEWVISPKAPTLCELEHEVKLLQRRVFELEQLNNEA